MSYRTQEILRMIIPGLYLFSMVLIIILIGGWWEKLLADDKKSIMDVLKGASNVVVLLLPFLGFVAGYMIECIMAFLERLFYVLGLGRPSKVVLGGCSIYGLNNLDEIKNKLDLKNKLKNKDTGKALQKAKQLIDSQKVEALHDTSIMARNVMGSQIVVWTFTLFYRGFLSYEFLWMSVMLLILGVYWYHRNCIYVKYVFSEFGKTIKPESSGSESENTLRTGGQ